MGIIMKRKLKSSQERVKKIPKITLEEIEDISTEDDDDDDQQSFDHPTLKKKTNLKGRRRGIEMGGTEDEEEEGELEARALRQAILEGAFDKFQSDEATDNNNDSDEHDDDGEEEEDEESGEDDDEDEEEDQAILAEAVAVSSINHTKALLAKAEELTSSHSWVETFDILSKDRLPFHDKSTKLDIHDDLKREVAFYNMALEAVQDAKSRCKAAKVPFTRPEDFFAEMIKTDDHMAKVKDRLIFETKKIAAFEQRKANKEQKLRVKEVRQHKISEKNKRKKQHMEEVNEWAKVAAQNRGGNNDDIIEKQFLNRMNDSNKPVKGAKRVAMDKKYGFGGKRGKFKQMDKKTINDMSSFNPRGNFAGGGMKKKSSKKKNQGANRPGKNKRIAARQKKTK